MRKHLSRLKGGGLARAAWPGRVVCLVLSDVVGDDLSTIASGPTVPDPTTYADALEVLHRRNVLAVAPRPVRRHLEAGAAGKVPETPKPRDRAFRRTHTRIVGSNRWTVEAAALEARRQGLRAVTLTTFLEGEAREVSRALVSVLRECVESGTPGETPVCLLAGGETTVSVRGDGLGGRNQELVVAAADPLSAFPAHAVVASLATDGIDGVSGAAGGIVDQESVRRAAQMGLAPPSVFLGSSDSAGFLAPLRDLIITGPTGTNVVDLTILLADRGPAPGPGDRQGAPAAPPPRGRISQARRGGPSRVGARGREAVACTTMTLPTARRTPSWASCGRRTREQRLPGRVPAGAAAFQQRAQLAEDRLAEVLNAYRALKTENEGFKERITKNLERRLDQRRERLLLKFIEILDNLDRALDATEQVYTGTPMIEGIILVRTELLSVLKDEGLERIPVLGLPYDPNVAEAVETRPVAEAEHHHMVVKELLRGYRLNGRVARAARVAIGEHSPEAGAAPDQEPLVGADEVPAGLGEPLAEDLAEGTDEIAPEFESLPPLPAEEKTVRGFDDALDELLAEPVEPEAPVAAARSTRPPAARPKATPARPEAPAAEIDLLKELERDE